jgi:hypothetical protein
MGSHIPYGRCNDTKLEGNNEKTVENSAKKQENKK